MHVLHLNLRLKGLDKKAVHLIPFETRNLQHSPLERGLQLFQARLVLKTGAEIFLWTNKSSNGSSDEVFRDLNLFCY